MRSGARRVRYGLEDIGYLLGRLLRAGGRNARRLWLRMSLENRRRIAAALALVLVVVAGRYFLVPVLPCEFPGGDACPPEDEVASLVPADALAYLHTNLDPDTEQAEAAGELAGKLPALTLQAISRLPVPGVSTAELERRVLPWFGGETGRAVVADETGAPAAVTLLEVAEEQGALRYAEATLGPRTETTEHAGRELRTGTRGQAAALVDDFLAVGDAVAVRAVLDVAEGDADSLSGSDPADEVRDELPEDRLADAYASEEGIAELLSRDRGTLGSLDPLIDFESSVGVAAALVVAGDAFEVEVESRLDRERLEADPGFFGALPLFDPGLASEASSAALAYVGVGDPGESVNRLLQQAAVEAPALAAGFKSLAKDVRRSGGIALERDVLPLLGSEGSLTLEPAAADDAGQDGEPREGTLEPETAGPPGDESGPPEVVSPGAPPLLTFLADDVDETQAGKALARLQGPIARAVRPEQGLQAPVYREGEIDGVETRSVRVSPAVDLTFAVFDGKLVVSTNPQGVEQVASGEGGLDSSDSFETATEGFPDELSLLAYLDLAGLVELAESAGLAEDPAYAAVAGDLRRLDVAGLAVRQEEAELASTVQVTVD